MNSTFISIAIPEFRTFLCELLMAYSVYEVDAEVTVQRLLNALCMGHKLLGLQRIPDILRSLDLGDIDPRGMTCVLSETPAITFFNGNQSLAEVTCTKAVHSVVAKAREMGVSLCVIKNCQSLGAPGVYSHLIAEQQCLGFCVTSSGHTPQISLAGQTEPWLKSHPTSWSLPSSSIEDVLTLEFYTANNPGFLGDPQLLPLEGPGGMLLSVVKGMITSVLAGRAFPVAKTQGAHLEPAEHFLLAIDPKHFGGMEKWNSELERIRDRMAQSVLAQAPITLKPLAESLTIDEQTWQQISHYAQKRKLTLPG